MIDFIKIPVDGGLPFINAGSTPIGPALLNFFVKYSLKYGANEIHVHPKHITEEGVMDGVAIPLLTLVEDPTLSYSDGFLAKDSSPVVMLKSLYVSPAFYVKDGDDDAS